MKETLWKSNLNFVKDIPMLRGGADKSLAQSGRKKASDQIQDLFNILPTNLNTLLSPLL